MPEDGSTSATPMAKEAAGSHAEAVQEIVDEVGATPAAAQPGKVKQALQAAPADRTPDSAPPLPVDRADEHAGHISRDHNAVVVPVEPQLMPPGHEVIAGRFAPPGWPRLAPRQRSLLIATVLCYLVGYPVALTVAPAIGWTLVMLGGLCLMGLGVVTIRRVHAQSGRSAEETSGPSSPISGR